VYISAFLEATLRDKSGYIPLFRDYRVAPTWLPETIYLNQFQDSSYQLVSTYEEDMNAATTTMPGGVQTGENLTVWREQAVELGFACIWADRYSAMYLGWNLSRPRMPPPTPFVCRTKGWRSMQTARWSFHWRCQEDPTGH
jgi:hypothetical protein